MRYAIVSNGSRVNGTRYNNAGWAALNISDETVAVNKPIKYINLKTVKVWQKYLVNKI